MSFNVSLDHNETIGFCKLVIIQINLDMFLTDSLHLKMIEFCNQIMTTLLETVQMLGDFKIHWKTNKTINLNHMKKKS